MSFRRFLAPAALAFGLAAALAAPVRAAERVTVFAAASTIEVMKEVAAAWHDASGNTAVISFDSSGSLARQIDSGAPASVFLSANVKWVDYLIGRKAVRADTRFTAFRNSLVLIAPKGSAATDRIDPATGTYAALAGANRLALGDPRYVPAGTYGRQTLKKLGLWKATSARIARTQNVRVALALVERGEAALGIVYRTDAFRNPKVRIVAHYPPELHTPIRYEAVETDRADKAADAFVAFMKSERATALYAKYGFVTE